MLPRAGTMPAAGGGGLFMNIRLFRTLREVGPLAVIAGVAGLCLFTACDRRPPSEAEGTARATGAANPDQAAASATPEEATPPPPAPPPASRATRPGPRPPGRPPRA